MIVTAPTGRTTKITRRAGVIASFLRRAADDAAVSAVAAWLVAITLPGVTGTWTNDVSTALVEAILLAGTRLSWTGRSRRLLVVTGGVPTPGCANLPDQPRQPRRPVCVGQTHTSTPASTTTAAITVTETIQPIVARVPTTPPPAIAAARAITVNRPAAARRPATRVA
jgi:hypothetical protein